MMTKLVIELANDKAKALAAKAKQAGLSPVELLEGVIDSLIKAETDSVPNEKGIPEDKFQEIKSNVLSKYAELYKRLA